MPSLYLLHALFSVEPTAEGDIHVHLQDYNALVLQLVTLPNIILTWCEYYLSIQTAQETRQETRRWDITIGIYDTR